MTRTDKGISLFQIIISVFFLVYSIIYIITALFNLDFLGIFFILMVWLIYFLINKLQRKFTTWSVNKK